jgi:hypothetical protein
LPSGKKIISYFGLSSRKCGNAVGVVLPNIKASIENYSKRWFEYPYPAATNVAGRKEWNILESFFAVGSLKEQIYGELQIMNLVTFGFL